MVVDSVHYLSAIFFPDSELLITGQTRQVFDNPVDFRKRFPAGTPLPEFVAALKNTPSFQVTTTDLEALLGMIDFYGTDCPGEVWLGYVKADCPDRLGLALNFHVQATVPISFLTTTRISGQQGQVVSAEFTIWPLFDGTNPPVIWESNVDLPPLFLEAYVDFTIGAGSVAGTLMNEIQSVSLDFGTTIDKFAGDGDVWDSSAFVKEHAPVLTIETLYLDAISSLPVEGACLSYKQYLRAINCYDLSNEVTAARTNNSTAGHIKILLNDTHVSVRTVAANGPNDAAMATYEFNPIATEVHPPVEISLAEVIVLP